MDKRLRLACALLIGIVLTLPISMQVQAEYLGFTSGRSAKISSLPDSSVEVGFLTGDISDSSYQHFGARFNLRTSPDFMAYFDLVQADVEEFDGLGYGVGFFYQIKGIARKNDFAAKLSYHTATLERSNSNRELDGNIISVEGLLSGQKIGESDLRWYANFGIHKFDFDNYEETEIGFGAGVVSDTGFGEFYGGFDLIDELTFGAGIRYHL